MEKKILDLLDNWRTQGYLHKLYFSNFSFFESYEDFTNQVYFIVLKKKDVIEAQKFENDAHFCSYIIQVVKNGLINYKAKACEISYNHTGQEFFEDIPAKERINFNEVEELVKELKFKNNQYGITPISLYKDITKELSNKEMTEKYGCSGETIRSYRKKMQKMLKKLDI